MRVWINGSVVPERETAQVAVTDQGFSVGHGVFQTLKVVNGIPFALTRHLARLEINSRTLGLPAPPLTEIRQGITELIDGHDFEGSGSLARLRISCTPGAAAPGLGAAAGSGTVVIQLSDLQLYAATAALALVDWRRNEFGALTGIKSMSFGENRLALARAQHLGADEALFANTAGDVCEGATSNIFYVRSGKVCTPTLASGCLPGVTRELLLEWAPEIQEVDAPVAVLDEASEIFLTSSTRNVQPVTAWNGRRLQLGPVAQRLASLWRRQEAQNLDP